MRLESSADAFLGKSKEMALLCGSVCHILFLIKVIQNEVRMINYALAIRLLLSAIVSDTNILL